MSKYNQSDDCGFLKSYSDSYYVNLLANAQLQPYCNLNTPYSTYSIERNIRIPAFGLASSYPISFVVNNNCQSQIKHVSLHLKDLTMNNFVNLGIALVNPRGTGVIMFYNPRVDLNDNSVSYGGTTYPSQPPVQPQTPLNETLLKVNVTFSDLQSNLTPWKGQSGMYSPNVEGSPSFAKPCPILPTTNNLSDFKYSQGLWKLYIQNFGAGEGILESAILTLYYIN